MKLKYGNRRGLNVKLGPIQFTWGPSGKQFIVDLEVDMQSWNFPNMDSGTIATDPSWDPWGDHPTRERLLAMLKSAYDSEQITELIPTKNVSLIGGEQFHYVIDGIRLSASGTKVVYVDDRCAWKFIFESDSDEDQGKCNVLMQQLAGFFKLRTDQIYVAERPQVAKRPSN